MRKLIALMLLLCCGPIQAAVVTIDFNGATFGAPGSGTVHVPQGFDVIAENELAIGLSEFGGFCPVVPGPPAVGNFYCAVTVVPPGPLEVSFVRGDSTDFDLLEMEVYLVAPLSIAEEAYFAAWDSDDNLVAQTSVSVAELGVGWQTVQFGSEWSGISRLSYLPQEELGFEAGSYAYIDNVKVNVIPIPAAVWLFSSALAGLGWMRRRQTRSSVTLRVPHSRQKVPYLVCIG